MIATAGLRPWIRRAALAAALLAAAGLALGLAEGPAGASGGGSGRVALAQAKKELLVQSDFPAGWTAQGGVTTGNQSAGVPPAFASGLVSCLDVPAALLGPGSAPTANSPTFSNQAQTDTASDTVSVYPSAKLASEVYQVFASPKVPACLTNVMQEPSVKQGFVKSIGSGASIGTVTVTKGNPAELIPHATAFDAVLPITVDNRTLNADLSIVTLLRGKVVSQVNYNGVGFPFPVPLEQHLVSVAYVRS
jgi:hypothetical protein